MRLSMIAIWLAASALILPLPFTSAGTLTGSVELKGRPPAAKSGASGYGKPVRVQRLSPQEALKRERENVVVYIADDAPGDGLFAGQVWPATPFTQGKQLEITQRDKEFIPHVLPVVVGTHVLFPNEDGFYHNVFSFSSCCRFDLGKYSSEDPAKGYTFTTPGLGQIFCDIHRNMRAYVLILENPFFAQPAVEDGAFTIEDIPPGTWNLHVWHPEFGEHVEPVEVGDGTLEKRLTLKR